jgi:hypothetical protein
MILEPTNGRTAASGDAVRAERGGQLDPQSLVVQRVGVLIGSPPFIAGKLP